MDDFADGGSGDDGAFVSDAAADGAVVEDAPPHALTSRAAVHMAITDRIVMPPLTGVAQPAPNPRSGGRGRVNSGRSAVYGLVDTCGKSQRRRLVNGARHHNYTPGQPR